MPVLVGLNCLNCFQFDGKFVFYWQFKKREKPAQSTKSAVIVAGDVAMLMRQTFPFFF